MEIIATGNFQKICISGIASQEECLIAWEKILKANGEATNDFSYNQFFTKVQVYAKLLDDYNTIKAILIRLHFIVDDSYIAHLNSKGYKIDTSTSAKYENSLQVALRKCENIVTKIAMKSNELITEEKDKSKIKKIVSFETMAANVSAGLGFEIKEDILLARYNEYIKIIIAKNKNNKQGGNRQQK